MNVDMKQIKLGAVAVAAVIVVGLGAHWYGASSHKPQIVSVVQAGAGLPSGSGFGVPLATLTQAAPGVAVSFGPLEGPATSGALKLRFDHTVEVQNREVHLINGELQLPVRFGRDNEVPQRITLTYRDGNLATVRYNGKSGGMTFNVRQELLAEALADETNDG
ncbi:MAG: hypothetical protein JJT90_17275 [Ectothiorhodospiraceae bacterium]|nr:hypothetical protein [Ectothiorhodospiraceae bacterium]